MTIANLIEALEPLKKIADAYDANQLDDEVRKIWGPNDEYTNQVPPQNIELFSGRGGTQLLTLKHCLDARAALAQIPLVIVVTMNDYPESIFSTRELADDYIRRQPKAHDHQVIYRKSYIFGLDAKVEKL